MGEESRSSRRRFRFCIDRGGTFTDVYAEIAGDPGSAKSLKLLSVDPHNYDDAPREGIRRILEQFTGSTIPRHLPLPTDQIDWIRMGTTVATNALLERKGQPIALCITSGFSNLLRIANQARPNIFDLRASKPSPLYSRVIQVNERVRLFSTDQSPQADEPNNNSKLDQVHQLSKDGKAGRGTYEVVRGTSGELVEVMQAVDVERLRPELERVFNEGIRSLAVVLVHSYIFPRHEQKVAELAREVGFTHVSLSSSLVPMIRAVPRGLTATVDAYLTPVIREYLAGFLSGFDDGLEHVFVSFMQSDGGLTPQSRFSGHKAILSGPAGGVVGYAKTTFKLETNRPLIGFDMGGTSTDVSRFAGEFEQVLETETAGVIIQAPQLDINTVAAGGGSKLSYQLGVFKVGPESVGAHPGPVCYRKGGQLAVTDANLVLGRVIPDYFPAIFGPQEDEPLDLEAARVAFEKLVDELDSEVMSVEQAALGFVDVANEAMCRPIRQLTEMKGYETGQHALACFGGAGPQHACAIAKALGIREVIVHRYCGILSAYGMGLADVVEEAQEPFAAALDGEDHMQVMVEVAKRGAALAWHVREQLRSQKFKEEEISTQLFLNLRYHGTDTTIMVPEPEGGDFGAAFVKEFRREYGFELQKRSILISDVRVRGTGVTNILKPVMIGRGDSEAPREARQHRVYFGSGWHQTPVYLLEKLGYGHEIAGPAIIMNGNSTIIVEPGSRASITKYGNVRIEVGADDGGDPVKPVDTKVDVIQLSIFNNRFMGIAEQMGRTLQRTSISTNIKERLDFSCALFSPTGGLVANAPHVPVHLGAMSSTVQWQLKHWGDALKEGDVLVTNHPAAGGSHLPDITVITPVFRDGKVIFFVASRGHHAEIGGITPGSMPPFSKAIDEEGAAIKAFKLVEGGVFQEEGISSILKAEEVGEDEHGNRKKIPGTRKLEDNLSDLRAQVAANQRGIGLIGELIEEYGLDVVQAYMVHVQDNAEAAVREMLKTVAGRARKSEEEMLVVLRAEDYMDDGSTIKLKLTIDSERGEAEFDFEGTSPEVYGNWNAPEAVTSAAVIYCLRCLVAVDIPLNQGCLAPVSIQIPKGSLLSPSDKAAVVGGNVLTSQRVTDVVLTAFEACACSQGCMNNLTFGDDSFGYYETIAGGSGAGPGWDGTSGIQCHMTNTRMTDVEILEQRYPVLLREFGLRQGSGGVGKFSGGEGVVREMEFRRGVTVSILSERRVHCPRGLRWEERGQRGEPAVESGRETCLPGWQEHGPR